jgi:hypothetical protein
VGGAAVVFAEERVLTLVGVSDVTERGGEEKLGNFNR